MSSTIIEVENLSKKYILSHQSQERYTALRDVLTYGVKRLGKKFFSPFFGHSSKNVLNDSQEEFYALHDVSFEVKQGDRVGIIGRNGAGKSTLLKVLSRITEPSSGRVTINGRVASLLEVGTGFHPELTGRENIYLNGAILGMSRVDIKRKFDEIVAFAEVERFLDTPVKRYSSGMYVRLAFAVAAHLEPEILIVDEVLAVGDAQFQEKCLGKMQEVGKEGRTVVFVSHNMGIVQQLCNRAIVLKAGSVEINADVETAVREYLEAFSPDGGVEISEKTKCGKAYIELIDLTAPDGLQVAAFFMNQDMRIVCDLNLSVHGKFSLSFQIKEMNDLPLFHFPCADSSFNMPDSPGKYEVSVVIPSPYLYPGSYRLQATLCEMDGNCFNELQTIEISFSIEQDYELVSRPLGRHAGVIYSSAHWHAERIGLPVQ